MTSPPHGPEPPAEGEGELVQWFIVDTNGGLVVSCTSKIPSVFSDVYSQNMGFYIRCLKAFAQDLLLDLCYFRQGGYEKLFKKMKRAVY